VPVEITLEMYAEKPIVLPSLQVTLLEDYCYILFAKLIQRASELLHELNVSKPYSVTPLRFRSKNRTVDGYVLDHLEPRKKYMLFAI
jgi:hypothetical protein